MSQGLELVSGIGAARFAGVHQGDDRRQHLAPAVAVIPGRRRLFLAIGAVRAVEIGIAADQDRDQMWGVLRRELLLERTDQVARRSRAEVLEIAAIDDTVG